MSGFAYLITDGFAACISNWLGVGGSLDAWFSYGEISMSLSDYAVLLDHPLSDALNKNPPLAVSADPEQVALEHKGLLLHVQGCTEKSHLGRSTGTLQPAGAVTTYLPLAPLNTALDGHRVRKQAGQGTRNMTPPYPCLLLPRNQGTHARYMYNNSVSI